MMMKRVCLLCATSLIALMANAISLGGVTYSVDTLALFPAGPGGTYLQIRMQRTTDGGGRLDAYLLTIDTRAEYVSMEGVLGCGKLVGTERPTAMAQRSSTDTKVFYAGTNGDFFQTTGDVGRPTGLTIINNEFAYTPNNNWRIGAVDEAYRGAIASKGRFAGQLLLADTALAIHHVNYQRGENQLVLYNRHNGVSTGTNAYGTECALELVEGQTWHTNGRFAMRVVSKEEHIGAMPIGQGQYVLSGHGEAAAFLGNVQVGDTVHVALSLRLDDQVTNVSNCVGGDNYALIVNNGQVEQTNFWNELHPRTAFGQTVTGDTLLMLVVDGRGQSAGCTTQVLGEIMQHYGAYKAVNWDGGGSSCMYVRGLGQMNRGSDGTERACGNGMFAVANVPAADMTVVSIAPYVPVYSLPRYGILDNLRFLGYNPYGVLVDTLVDRSQIQLSCDAALGQIMPDGRFMLTGTEGGVIHARYGTYSTDIQVRYVQSAPVAFRLDSVLADQRHPYEVEVQATIGRNKVSLMAGALTWETADEQIATVDSLGRIVGKMNGRTEVVGQLGAFSDTIQVHVEIADRHCLKWCDFKEPRLWSITESKGFGAAIEVPETEELPADMQFRYATTRSPFIRMGYSGPLYSLPDTIRLVLQTDALVEKIGLGLRANLAAEVTNYVCPQTIEPNVLTTLDIPVKDLFQAEAATYPIFLDYLRFSISTSTTAGLHHIYLHGIYLLYDGLKDEEMGLYTPPLRAGRKSLVDGQVLILHDGKTYTATGTTIEK